MVEFLVLIVDALQPLYILKKSPTPSFALLPQMSGNKSLGNLYRVKQEILEFSLFFVLLSLLRASQFIKAQ